jgi:ADP-heptose:LPS heptosyltransferase
MFHGDYNYRCRLFNGYKPCEPGRICNHCDVEDPFDSTILLINLDAMGDVLMTTCMLAPLRRRYPRSLLTWITLPGHAPLLEGNPMIDRVWMFDATTITVLDSMQFDLILNADKGRASCALTTRIRASEKRGFGLNPAGMIIPENPESRHLYRLGLDDRMKFVLNRRTGQDLLAEAFCLPYARDGYVLEMSEEERRFTSDYRRAVAETRPTIGIQTGCSDLYPLKSFTEDHVVGIVGRLRARHPNAAVLLLGGPQESNRNAIISRRCNDCLVIQTPTREGLRRGMQYIDACDVVISPDTGAMHVAIALRKWVIGWFNVSCSQEIDLFERGAKITTPLPCSPCWRKTCPAPICLPVADLDAIVQGIAPGLPPPPLP